MSDNKQGNIPKTISYFAVGLASYFISDKIKEEFLLSIPTVVVLFEVLAIMIFTAIIWFVKFNKKKYTKASLLSKLKIVLMIFGIYSLLFFVFVNFVYIQVNNADKILNLLVGFYDMNGGWVTDHQSLLERSDFQPELAYKDVGVVKNILFFASLVYIYIVTSLVSIIIEFAGVKLVEE